MKTAATLLSVLAWFFPCSDPRDDGSPDVGADER